jgi:ribonuclease R
MMQERMRKVTAIFINFHSIKKRLSRNMKKFTLNQLENKIISLLSDDNNGYTIKELRLEIGVEKNKRALFKKVLHKLKKTGRIKVTKQGKIYLVSSKSKKVTGELRISKGGFGFVHDEIHNMDIFISKDHLNTAFDHDLVEVTLYANYRGKNAEGFVTKVIKRFRTKFVGTFHQTKYYGYVVPDNPRIYRDFFIPKEKQNEASPGQKVLVSLDKWETDHLNPEGTIIQIIGYTGEKGVDIVSVACSFELEVKFSEIVESEAEQIPAQIDPQEIERRQDLRAECCFTIDPEDAKDFDDAVSIKMLGDGNYELGVHIADVSYYVKENSKVDREAFKRGTSVYLVDRVIPMLPERLSNYLCSLQENQDRLTFSCIMKLTRQGELFDYQIVPSIINSKKRFSYEEVQNILNTNSTSQYAPNLKMMYQLSTILTKKRLEEGSIDFETPEVSFKLDDKGFPLEIKCKERLASHRLIEEFMLLANKTIARHIGRISPPMGSLPFVYRVHEKPDPEKMDKFFNLLEALGYKVNRVKKVTPKYFQKILNNIHGKKEEIVIEEVALRSMMRAVYATKNVGHFGLAFKEYTHFTSPIRRYPDLMVHRLIKNYTSDKSSITINYYNKYLPSICEQSTRTERNAMEAERESIRIKKNEYISQYIDNEFEGFISGVMPFGIFVELRDTLVEGLVHIQDINDDYYIYDEKTFALIGRETDRVLRLGDQVKIKVKKVNLEEGKVDFILVQ